MATFFIPGVGGDPTLIEGAYRDMSGVIELEMGRRPQRPSHPEVVDTPGKHGLHYEVGISDPLCGGTMMAIFDMGPHQPFIVWWQPDTGRPGGVREILGCNAHAMLEFDS